jgi:hypothetical protein
MNFQGKIEFTGDGRRKNIQQHTFPTMKGRDERGEEKRSKLLALMLIYTQFIPQVDLLIFFSAGFHGE